MIVVYVALLFLLGVSRWLVQRRVTRLERKYSRVAQETQALSKQPVYREGNGSRPDACKAAKHQLVLGQLVQKRDRVESRYTAWQGRAERLGRMVKGLRGWEGRWFPYLLGAVDAVLILVGLSLFAQNDPLKLREVVETVASAWPR
jgi:hypothetical protein